MFYILLLATSLLPQISQAATTGSLQSLLSGIGGVLNNILIQFIIALAFLFFVINVVRFFIIKGHDPEGQKNARYLAFYSIATFVFIFSFWGIINFLIGGFGFDNNPCLNDTTSDYVTSDSAHCTSSAPHQQPAEATGSGTGGSGVGISGSGSGTGGSGVGISGSGTGGSGVGATSNIINNKNLLLADGFSLMLAREIPIKSNRSLIDIENKIKQKAPNNNDLVSYFGNNKDIVVKILFADMYENHSDGITYLNRARAIYRLEKLGNISEAESKLNNYLSELNNYYAELGINLQAPTLKRIKNIKVPLPDKVTIEKNKNKQDILEVLRPYENSQNLNMNSIIDNLFVIGTLDQRYENFSEVNDLLVRNKVNSTMIQSISNKFRTNINTEKIFAGEFNLW